MTTGAARRGDPAAPVIVRNVLLASGSSADLGAVGPLLAGTKEGGVLDFAATVLEPEVGDREALAQWRQRAWGTPAPPEAATAWGEAAGGELGYRFFTRVAPPEQWLEAVAKIVPTVDFDLIYQAVDGSFAGRTAWRSGELAAYDWLDPTLDYDVPSPLGPALDAMSGPVDLDDGAGYSEPIGFTSERAGDWASALVAEAGPVLFAFSLWLLDPGDVEAGDAWRPYYGPLTDWTVRPAAASVAEWVERTMARAFEVATAQGPPRTPHAELETRVIVEVFPASAEGWYRIPPVR